MKSDPIDRKILGESKDIILLQIFEFIRRYCKITLLYEEQKWKGSYMRKMLLGFLIMIISGLSHATYVRGFIDPVEYTSGKFAISGWACQTGFHQSIKVHLYLDAPAGSGGKLITWTTANRSSEPAVSSSCGTFGVSHRFRFYLNYEEMEKYKTRKIYVHGISIAGTPNLAITKSGDYRVGGYPFVSYTDSALFRRTFDPRPTVTFSDDFLSFASFNGNNFLKARYVPYERGSKRILKKIPLTQSVTEATLSYDVKFHKDFEFVKGGKLHGLQGGEENTGCAPINPDGWSVRVNFTGGGGARLYIYHQDRVAECGDGYSLNNFTFSKDVWYRVDLYVKMNTSPTNADGIAEIYIDGAKVAEKYGLRLSGNANINIEHFKFTTFHGGHDPSNAPSKEVYAYFDNFTVKQGKVISGTEGANCEFVEKGIFSPGGACCANSCGSCGGSGCGNLDGGSSACCYSGVSQSPLCSYPATEAPCSF